MSDHRKRGDEAVDTYPFELTKLECIYLSDALSMFAPGPPGPGEHGAHPDLLLKVLSALVEADPAGQPVVVPLTQNELWIVREVSKSSVMVGAEKVGLSLLTKVAKGLLTLTTEAEVQEVVARFGETHQQEPGKANYRTSLKKLKSGGKRGEDTDGDNTEGSHKDHSDDAA